MRIGRFDEEDDDDSPYLHTSTVCIVADFFSIYLFICSPDKFMRKKHIKWVQRMMSIQIAKSRLFTLRLPPVASSDLSTIEPIRLFFVCCF